MKLFEFERRQKLGDSKHLKNNKLYQRKASWKRCYDIHVKYINHTKFIYLKQGGSVEINEKYYLQSANSRSWSNSYPSIEFRWIKLLISAMSKSSLTWGRIWTNLTIYIFSFPWSSCLLYVKKVIGNHRHGYPPSICIKGDSSLGTGGGGKIEKRAILSKSSLVSPMWYLIFIHVSACAIKTNPYPFGYV